MEICKYQSLGNAYLAYAGNHPLPETRFVQNICDCHWGIGSDGLLWGQSVSDKPGHFRLKIFNPDGSLAEKSGNGIRIFAQYLKDQNLLTSLEKIVIETDSGSCPCSWQGETICIDMGIPNFLNRCIPESVSGRQSRTPLNFEESPIEENLSINGKRFEVVTVSMGNPHCVVFLKDKSLLNRAFAEQWGHQVEHLKCFPQRTNVQFVYVNSPEQLFAEIWERGAGYTLSSGSSACAIFAAAHQKGYCKNYVNVTMPGGSLVMSFSEKGSILQYGTAKQIARCWINEEDF